VVANLDGPWRNPRIVVWIGHEFIMNIYMKIGIYELLQIRKTEESIPYLRVTTYHVFSCHTWCIDRHTLIDIPCPGSTKPDFNCSWFMLANSEGWTDSLRCSASSTCWWGGAGTLPASIDPAEVPSSSHSFGLFIVYTLHVPLCVLVSVCCLGCYFYTQIYLGSDQIFSIPAF
jgi:hypothetical protein